MPGKLRTNYAQRRLSDSETSRQRTTLVSLSVMLIIFALAGGHVTEHTTILSLPIRFSRPVILLWAAWLIWGHYLYKFLLTTTPPWDDLRAEIYLRAIANPKVHAMCLPALPRFKISAPHRAGAHRQLSDGWTFAISKNDGVLSFDPTQLYWPAVQPSPAGAA